MILVRVDEETGSFEYVEGARGMTEDLTLHLDAPLAAGVYLIYIEAEWPSPYVTTYTVNTYSETKISLKKWQFEGFLEKALSACAA